MIWRPFFITAIVVFSTLFTGSATATFKFSTNNKNSITLPGLWTGGENTVVLTELAFTSCGARGNFLGSWRDECFSNFFYSEAPDPFTIQLKNISGNDINDVTTDIPFGSNINLITSIKYTYKQQTVDLSNGQPSRTITLNSPDLQTDSSLKVTINGQLLDIYPPGTHTAQFKISGIGQGRKTQHEDGLADISVDIEIPSRVRVSGLQDITLTTSNSDSVRSPWIPFLCFFRREGVILNFEHMVIIQTVSSF